MPWLGKISTITEAFQFCIPCSLERAPPARHYFINIKGFGLYKCHTCRTTVPGGITLCAGKHATNIKSFHFPKLSAFQWRVPPLSPGRLATGWGTSHFLSSPDPSGPHSTFLFRPSARRGRENGGGTTAPPGSDCSAMLYLVSWPRLRPARAGHGKEGFYFCLNIVGEG